MIVDVETMVACSLVNIKISNANCAAYQLICSHAFHRRGLRRSSIGSSNLRSLLLDEPRLALQRSIIADRGWGLG